MTKIVLWPAGRRTENYLRYGYFDDCEIVGIVDSNKCREPNAKIGSYDIQSPANVKKLMEKADYLIIATKYFEKIYAECLKMGISKERIILTDFIRGPLFAGDMDKVRSISEKLYRKMLLTQYQLIKINERDTTDDRKRIEVPPFDDIEYRSDYFRYRTFEFMAEKLMDDGVEGALAEFGVFQARFSALIMEKLLGRKMYWFDTFDGFSQEENEREADFGRSDEEFFAVHRMTSLEQALGNVSHPENVIVCKGLFPMSIIEEAQKERFSFVSIDVDFEDSTYEGLKFFYPRLNEGGCIFLHDYNSARLGGVKVAVERYETDFDIKLKAVPLADRAGTLVIIK